MQSCRAKARPGSWRRGIYLVWVFVLVMNVVWPAVPETAFAGLTIEEESHRDLDSETTEASREAKDKLEGATRGVSGIFSDIRNFFVDTWTAFDTWMDHLFGFDNAEGTEAYFGTLIYAFLLIVFLFVGKFVYNIFAGLFTYKGRRPGRVQERYRKP